MNKLIKTKRFAVATTSLDDGFPFYSSYWSTRAAASCSIAANCRTNSGDRIVEVELWMDEDGNYYKLDIRDLEPTLVDAPTRNEVLAKLTDKEKKVLGLL